MRLHMSDALSDALLHPRSLKKEVREPDVRIACVGINAKLDSAHPRDVVSDLTG
jgi:hypothetical protein